MVNKDKTKKVGFTLAEALVSMAVISIFFLCTTKVVTTRPKHEVEISNHGYIECYCHNDSCYQTSSVGLNYTEATRDITAEGSHCSVTLPKGVPFVTVYSIKDGIVTNQIETQVTQSTIGLTTGEFGKLGGDLQEDAKRQAALQPTEPEPEPVAEPGDVLEGQSSMTHFLQNSYPNSKLSEIMGDLEQRYRTALNQLPEGEQLSAEQIEQYIYKGPALFICW